MYYMAWHPHAIQLLESNFPWQSLTVMLNTLLVPYKTLVRIKRSEFPLLVKDDECPFTKDFTK